MITYSVLIRPRARPLFALNTPPYVPKPKPTARPDNVENNEYAPLLGRNLNSHTLLRQHDNVYIRAPAQCLHWLRLKIEAADHILPLILVTVCAIAIVGVIFEKTFIIWIVVVECVILLAFGIAARSRERHNAQDTDDEGTV